MFGISGHKCEGFIRKTFETGISSGKVEIKNLPYRNEQQIKIHVPTQSAGR